MAWGEIQVWLAAIAPTRFPTRSPNARTAAAVQERVPSRAYHRTPRTPTGSSMAAKDVPTATRCSNPRSSTMTGTMMAPPPIPKSPPRIPAVNPRMASPAI